MKEASESAVYGGKTPRGLERTPADHRAPPDAGILALGRAEVSHSLPAGLVSPLRHNASLVVRHSVCQRLCGHLCARAQVLPEGYRPEALARRPAGAPGPIPLADRKSTRLNSSHVKISYAV